MERCGECGFVDADLPRAEVAPALHGLAHQFAARLRGTGAAALRRRPAPAVWSPLEYGAHVRDVLVVQRERILRALIHDGPTYAPMRRDERVVEQRDNESDPATVADQLGSAAAQLAHLVAGLTDEEWDRVGIYPWPAQVARDVDWIARHTVHELVHHLFDVARTLQGPTGTPHGLGSG
ncbi:DinB family protein [Actinomarinicola tropica]|uniref:DinB family protein n=1 Tax=Actinomarinicola tropica TaxID=2789776 RepID=A0A5Q2RH59_9ACTN|nr:DinB family protein [Actinomarinicola tropica]QGG96158.1 DinB family protein [Actinomarinicola tropica]